MAPASSNAFSILCRIVRGETGFGGGAGAGHSATFSILCRIVRGETFFYVSRYVAGIGLSVSSVGS